MINKTEIEEFNENIELGKYIAFAQIYIINNKDELEKNIKSEHEGRLNIPHRILRKFELPDITWNKETTVQEIYNNLEWNVVRFRIINLKICSEIYANRINMEIKKYYEDIEKTCPSFKITLPDGKTIHVSKLLKDIRDELTHAKHNKKSPLGIQNIDDLKKILLTIIYVADDGNCIKVATYNSKNKSFNEKQRQVLYKTNNTNAGYKIYEHIESEYIQMIRVYDAIRRKEIESEKECSENKYWVPMEYLLEPES